VIPVVLVFALANVYRLRRVLAGGAGASPTAAGAAEAVHT
jgi:hypothetical protein